MLSLVPERVDRILLLGAHCTDIAVGAGGALLELCRAHPGVTVVAVVFTGGGSLREEEERSALAAFCPGARLELTVLDLPDERVPVRWERAAIALDEVAAHEPDLVFAPAPGDGRRPDHGALAALVPTVFRHHVVLGYEMLIWDGELGHPNVFLPLAEPVLREKIDKLHEHYGSQRDRGWFDGEAFAGIARTRGVQCRARYAEAFHVTRLMLSVAQLPGLDPMV